MKISFTKMHGLGNDFVVIDAINQSVDLSPEQIRFIADRNRGIGCDQLLLVQAPTDPSVLFTYRIFNANGGEVEHCGNGARCFARFVYDNKLTQQTTIPVATNAGNIVLQIEDSGDVRVNMGIPNFIPERVPFISDAQALHYSLTVNGHPIDFGVVSIGNPHLVTQVDDVDSAPVAELGPQLESHPRFPNHVNVGFMQVVDQNMIRLRVFERGVGETQACGTGACAAMVTAKRWKLAGENVHVALTGGTLNVSWQGEGQPVYLSGPAQTVFEGSIEL